VRVIEQLATQSSAFGLQAIAGILGLNFPFETTAFFRKIELVLKLADKT